MNIRYSLINWSFNKELWGNVIASAAREFGEEAFAEMVGVDKKTVQNWAAIARREKHQWPAMHNFMIVINLLDLTPSDFFILEE